MDALVLCVRVYDSVCKLAWGVCVSTCLIVGMCVCVYVCMCVDMY